MYLDYADEQAERIHILMTIEYWKENLDVFLKFNERDVLNKHGKFSHKIAEKITLSDVRKLK